MIEPDDPRSFARRTLLVSVGLSPQVATCATHALAEAGVAPTRLILLTTSAGAAACRTLLLGDGGAFARYATEWSRPWAAALARTARLEVVETDSGDLDERRGATSFAERAAALVRQQAEEDDGALHVSVAGGRKTAGAALAIAMCLWGRPQDRLSHLITDPAVEGHPAFFFPARTSTALLGRAGEVVDAAAARVRLVEIAFPRLRNLVGGAPATLESAVAAAQATLVRTRLVVDGPARVIRWDGATLGWPPAPSAFLAWLAADLLAGGEGLPRAGARRALWLAAYALFAPAPALRAAARRTPDPLDPEWMEEKASRVAKLGRSCGVAPRGASLVSRIGPRAASRYRLALDPQEVGWVGAGLGVAA